MTSHSNSHSNSHSSTHDDARLSLGAYALGTLEPADQRLVEAHLAGCPACLGELADLASVVPALAGLSAVDLAPPAPSPDLFARIASAVDTVESPEVDGDAADTVRPFGRPSGNGAADRRPRRWLVAVAASVVLLVGAGTAVGIAVSHSSHPSTTVSAVARGIDLRVTASDAPTGTRLVLTAKGLHAHEHCRLVATAADGSTHPAGRWSAGYEGHASVVERTDVPRSQLRRLTLFGNGGTKLIAVDI